MKVYQISLICTLLVVLCGTVYALNDMPLLAQFQGEHNGSGYGYSVLSLDFNHDGYDDLVVLSSFYGYQYQQTPSRGKVYIYYGGPGFNSATQPTMTLEGDYPEGMQRKITRIYNVGDVNGDTYDDLMIIDTVPDSQGSTRYMYYFGLVNDLSTPHRIESELPGQDIYTHFLLGDVDGDGFGDVGITYKEGGIYKFDILWGGTFIRQIIYMGSDILPDISSINGIGDFNNDGYDDFAIGFIDGVGGIPCNIIRFYHGNSLRCFDNPTVLVQTTETITRISLPLGDLNGDGFDDFFGYATPDGLMIWFGSENIVLSNPDLVLNPVYYGNNQVRGINSGDINGDGYSDVAGASYSLQRFAVWLGSNNMNGQADWQKTSTYENYGYDLAIGDYNGDGYCDIAVSAPFEEGSWPTHDFRGYVFIYAGNTGMVANDDPHAPQLSEHLQLRMSPNPVRSDNEINIEVIGTAITKGEFVKIQVFNLKGQVVHQTESYSTLKGEYKSTIRLSDYPSGIYICRTKFGEMQIIKKFTIIK